MTTPGTDGRGRRRSDLQLLRKRAMANPDDTEAAGAYETACREHAAGVARTYRRDIYYVDEADAESIADQAWSKAVAGYGRYIERAESVQAILARIAWNCVVNQVRRGTMSFSGRLRSLDEPVCTDPAAPGLEFSTSGGQAGRHESVRDEDDVADAAERGQATATARRRLARLREEARQPGNCPFHLEAGCPHGDRVIDLIGTYVTAGELLNEAERGTIGDTAAGQVSYADDLLASGEFERRLVEEGRRLGVPASGRGARRVVDESRKLSTADQTLNRHFRHCLWWWSYRAFAGSAADETPGGKLWIRMRLISLLRLKPDGTWQSSACPKEGARHMLGTDPEFGRLLLWLDEAGERPLGTGTYKKILDVLGKEAS